MVGLARVTYLLPYSRGGWSILIDSPAETTKLWGRVGAHRRIQQKGEGALSSKTNPGFLRIPSHEVLRRIRDKKCKVPGTQWALNYWILLSCWLFSTWGLWIFHYRCNMDMGQIVKSLECRV